MTVCLARCRLFVMFRHCCVVVMWLAAVAQAQQQPIIAPLSYTAFLDPSDVSVRFTCTGEGFPFWRVDGQAASSTEIANRGIIIETNDDGGSFTSQIIIPATVENNNTEVQCVAVSDNNGFSEIATFRIQGRRKCKHVLYIILNVHACRSSGSTPQPHYCGQ